MKLQLPYVVDDPSTRVVYYAALDILTSALVKQMHQPLARLVDAYVEVVKASTDLG